MRKLARSALNGVFALKLNLAAPCAEGVFDEVGAELSLAETRDQFFEDGSKLFVADEAGVVVKRGHRFGCGNVRELFEGPRLFEHG